MCEECASGLLVRLLDEAEARERRSGSDHHLLILREPTAPAAPSDPFSMLSSCRRSIFNPSRPQDVVPEVYRCFQVVFFLSGLYVFEAHPWCSSHAEPSVFSLLKSSPDCWPHHTHADLLDPPHHLLKNPRCAPPQQFSELFGGSFALPVSLKIYQINDLAKPHVLALYNGIVLILQLNDVSLKKCHTLINSTPFIYLAVGGMKREEHIWPRNSRVSNRGCPTKKGRSYMYI